MRFDVPILLISVVFPVAWADGPPEKIPGSAAAVEAGTGDITVRRGETYYHLMKAQLAMGRGRATDVLDELREATSLEPDSAGLHAEAARMIYRLGRRSEAERLARRAIEIDPNQGTALRVLADLSASRALGPGGDPAARDEAIRLYETLTIGPDADNEVFPTLIRLKLLAEDTAGAVEVARAYVARRPGDASAVRILSQVLAHRGQEQEALHALSDFLASNPTDEDLLSLVADLTRQTGAWSTLDEVCRRMLEVVPRNVLARTLRGEALLRLERPGEAAEEFQKAMELDAREPAVRMQLATAYSDLGRLADAAALVTDLVREFPEDPVYRAILGETLARQGNLEGAIGAYQPAIAGFSSKDQAGAERRDEVRRRIVMLYLARKRPAEAKGVLGELERADTLESLRSGAAVALDANDLRGTRELARSLREKGDLGDSALIEGEVLVREGKLAKARAKFEDAVKALGAGGRGSIADIYRDAGRQAEAEETLTEWIRLEPENPEARLRLGSFFERAGRFQEAEKELREAMRLAPKSAEAFNYLGYSLADRDQRLQEALELIRKAVALDPWNGAYLDSLGWALFRLGRYDEAREPLRRASREFPTDPTILDHLGDLFDRLGERGEAKTAWQHALEAGFENPELLQRKISGVEKNSPERLQSTAPIPRSPR